MISIIKKKITCREDIFPSHDDGSDKVRDTVSAIISDVRKNGDCALRFYAEKFDGAKIDNFEVTKEETDEAFASLSDEFINILGKSAENIEFFHKNQLKGGFEIKREDGVVLGQRVLPVKRAGLYIPGGTAAYPSSVLMNCIPAKLAGVEEIILCTPVKSDNKINPAILAAAKLAGADRIFKSGGAQAIAAMAYGTESIPAVDVIAGPGNAYVAEAKRQVCGTVGIDMIAGPSEILVIADGSCNPEYAAADLLSQAEHDRLAKAVLVTDSEELANAVSDEIEKQLKLLDRESTARASIDAYGKIIIVDSIESAVEISNIVAPEHLEICVDNPSDYLDKVRNAGSVFLGKSCPEALGDYFAGPNHTLPTSGTARFSSPLSVDNFMKRSAYSYYTREALEKASDYIIPFANAEGLGAHANSVAVRVKREEKKK